MLQDLSFTIQEISRSRSRSFFFLVICFLLGIAFHSLFLSTPFFVACLLSLVSLTLVFFIKLYQREYIIISLGVLFFSLGIFRFALHLEPWGNELVPWRDKNISIEGTVTKSVKGRASTIMMIRSEYLHTKTSSEKTNEKILIYLPKFREYEVGRALKLSCLLRQRKEWPRASPRWSCSPSSIREQGFGDLNFAENVTAITRRAFLNGLKVAISEPQLSLAQGLILGDDFGFSSELLQSFIITGTAHIVAVSGWNVTMVINALLVFLIFLGLPRARLLPVLLFFILFYVMFTGSGSSVVRAGIMGTLLSFASRISRPYRAKNAIAAAAAVMVAISPQILVFDISFILSFAATLGLVFIYPMFRRLIPKKNKIHILRAAGETMAQTGAATIFTVPVILFVFGRFSLIAPMANLFILPAVPVATVASFCAGLASMLHPVLGQAAGIVAWIPITYIISMAEFLAGLPFASVEFSSFWGRALVILIPIVSISAFTLLKKKKDDSKIVWKIED